MDFGIFEMPVCCNFIDIAVGPIHRTSRMVVLAENRKTKWKKDDTRNEKDFHPHGK